MAFVAREIATIRDTLLGYWLAEYAANGETLLITAGSDAYLLAGMIAVIQNACDVQAAQVAKDIFPDTASDEAITRFGYVYGVARRPGVAARLSVDVTGTPSTVVTIPAGSQLSWTDGTLYDCDDTSVTLDGSGDGTIASVTCTTVGVAGSRTAGDVLTWQSAPAGLDPTGMVDGVVTPGDEAEGYQAWAQRIIGRLRERPASGNRADWKAWVEAYTALDIEEVYVYPLLEPPTAYPGTGTVGILGCVTVVAIGPAQGDSVTNTRVLGAGAGLELTEVKEYINGTRTAAGEPTATGTQLRPVTMSLGDISIESIAVNPEIVIAVLTVTDACAFPFTSTPTVDASSTATSIQVTGNYASGGVEDLSSRLAQVQLSTAAYRGGFYAVTLGTGSYNGGTGRTTFAVSTMPGTPVAAVALYPAPACFSDVRAAVIDYFDALGPGDVSPTARWPTQDSQGRSTLYLAALAGDITDVSGVLSATITSPVANVTPAQKTVVTLNTFRVIP